MIGKNLYPGIISITRLQKAGAKFDNWAPRQNIDRFTVKSAFFSSFCLLLNKPVELSKQILKKISVFFLFSNDPSAII